MSTQDPPNPSGIRARVAGTLAAQLTVAIVAAFGGVLAARALGAEGRGQLAQGLLWANILALLMDFGLGFAFAFFARGAATDLSRLWTVALVWAFASGTSTVAIATVAILKTSAAASPLTALLACFAVPFVLVGGFQAYLLLGRGDVRGHNWVRAATAILYTAGIGAVALTGQSGPVPYAAAFLVSHVLGAGLGGYLLRAKHGARTIRVLGRLRPLVAYALKTQVASFAAQANLRLDQLVISFVASASDLGRYVVAVAFASMIGPLFSAVATVALADGAQGKPAGPHALRILKWTALAGLAITLPAIAVAPILLPWLFGKAFASAVAPARILLAASLPQGLNAVMGNLLRVAGRPGSPTIAECGGLLVTCALLPPFLVRYGLNGAALVSLASYLTVCCLQGWFLARATADPPASRATDPLAAPLARTPAAGTPPGSQDGESQRASLAP